MSRLLERVHVLSYVRNFLSLKSNREYFCLSNSAAASHACQRGARIRHHRHCSSSPVPVSPLKHRIAPSAAVTRFLGTIQK